MISAKIVDRLFRFVFQDSAAGIEQDRARQDYSYSFFVDLNVREFFSQLAFNAFILVEAFFDILFGFSNSFLLSCESLFE